MTNVTLTREQRDGLRWFVACHLEADDLGHRVRDENAVAVKELVDSLPPCIRVLDQLGWEESGSEYAYELTLDPGLLGLVAKIRPSIEGAIRDDLSGLVAEPALEHDRAALAAADLIEGVMV